MHKKILILKNQFSILRHAHGYKPYINSLSYLSYKKVNHKTIHGQNHGYFKFLINSLINLLIN